MKNALLAIFRATSAFHDGTEGQGSERQKIQENPINRPDFNLFA